MKSLLFAILVGISSSVFAAKTCSDKTLENLNDQLSKIKKAQYDFMMKDVLHATETLEYKKFEEASSEGLKAVLECARNSNNSAYDHVKYALTFDPEAVAKLKAYKNSTPYINLQADGKLKIADYLDGNSLIIFRALDNKYVPGEVGRWSKSEKVYSFTMDPNIISIWGGSSPFGVELVGIQDITTDNLKYPLGEKNRPKECSDLSMPCFRAPLFPELTIGDIAFYNEVNPTHQSAKVLISFPEWYMLEFIENYKDRPMTPTEVIDTLLSHIEIRPGIQN